MKQVLLAIDGAMPTKPVFQYAVGLCRRIGAGLNILQFFQEARASRRLAETRGKVGRLGRLLEDSFAGVAFAEEGMFKMADSLSTDVSDPLKELIQASPNAVPVRAAVSGGRPETDISRYVEAHQDIVLTIFDPSGDRTQPPGRRRTMIDNIRKRLRVPLVVVRTSGK